MNYTDMITTIYYRIDEAVKSNKSPIKPGPTGKLSESEIITIMVIQPIIMPFCDSKRYYRVLADNFKYLFPHIPCYERMLRLFKKFKDKLIELMHHLSLQSSFGLIADGTSVSVMETIRGKFAKSFRDARKVPCISKREWYWGFVLVLLIDQSGTLAFASIGTGSEVAQFKEIVKDLKDRWILSDRGFRGMEYRERFWNDNQVKIKITGGKERQWIENVIGFLKDKLGLARIRKIRKSNAFFVRVFSILCAYNLIIQLGLTI
jgi:hypothetical protein